MSNNIENKVVLITGASSGIGQATAELLAKKGAKIVISNSDPKNSNTDDDFFDNIYSAHKIKRVEATRMINCNSEARGKIKELLISNF